MKDLTEKIKELPKAPGVYLFKDDTAQVLYVGKATSLKDRVRQYFSGQEEKSRGKRMRLLVEATVDIETIETDTVLEALILEAQMIKKFMPYYNVMGKDDKSMSYFVITKEDFPRVIILRETDFDKEKFQAPMYKKGKVFGPYRSKEQMQIALKIIRKIFPFHNRAERTEKGCLSYQIGMCPGPFDGAISQEEYKRHIRNISLFLSGHKKKLLKELEREMTAHAAAEEFELAEKVKRQIFSLTHINDIALMSRDKDLSNILPDSALRLEAYDISHISGEHTVASMVVSVNGTLDNQLYRKFKVKAVEGINDVSAMREIIGRRLNHLHDWGKPDVIILDGGKGHLNMGERLFRDFGVPVDGPEKISLLAVAKGPTRKKVDLYSSKMYTANPKVLDDLTHIEELREEAHRFAITYHKALRDKKML